MFFVASDGGSLLAVVKAAVTRVVSSDTLVATTVGGAREGSARADSVGNSTTGVASAETGDCAEAGISETVNNTTTSVLNAALRCVIELVEVTVATSNSAGNLDISGVVGIVGNITLVIDELSAVVVVVSSVVPGTEVVGPAAIAVVLTVVVAVRVGAGGVGEGVAAHADGVADGTRDVLVALVANTSLLVAVVGIVVAGDGVDVHVDLTGLVAPLVVNGLLGVEVVVGAPLVPGVVNPLVVALALVASLTVGVVGGGPVERRVAIEAETELAVHAEAALAVAAVALSAVVLVVSTVGLSLELVSLNVASPGLDGRERGGENERFEHG